MGARLVSDITKTVRAEILRLAKKEAKAEVARARESASQYRKQIAELKRLLAQREREIKHLRKRGQAGQPEDTALTGVRFSRKSILSQRRRLGLSAEQYGKLVGVTALAVYNWENGKSRPRRAKLAALVAIRGISKREAMERLAKLGRS